MTENAPEPNIAIDVDVTNPGQFFACCGLLELASRLWQGAEGGFDNSRFKLFADCSEADLCEIVNRLRRCQLIPENTELDDKICPLRIRESVTNDCRNQALSMRLDWWLDDSNVGGSLKTWAGQQKVTVISRAMLHSGFADEEPENFCLDQSKLAHLPESPNKIVEPFYFDARRFAHALDTGFSLDAQEAKTAAYPAVELLCLIGLQRFRPRQSSEFKWGFEYWTWNQPLCPCVAAPIACGAVAIRTRQRYRFSLRFRDDQKRYKAFSFSTPLGDQS